MLRDLAEAAASAGDRSSEWTARLEHARIQFMIGPDPVPLATIRREAEEAARSYGASGDDGGLERAMFLLGCVHQRAGEMVAGAEVFRGCITLADRSGDVRERLASRWMRAMLLVAGPVPVEGCLDECVEMATSLGSEHPGLLTERAALCAMAGRFDEARASNERARHIFVNEMRAPRMLMFLAQSRSTIELLAGDLDTAEEALRTRLELARGSKEPENISQAAARLAFVVRHLGRPGDAAELARESADVAPVEGVTEQALSRAAMACAASDEGDHASAERLAHDAVAQVPEEMLNLRADLLVELAGIMRAADRPREAAEATAAAARLYALKGNLAAMWRLQTPG
jgi:tetratricopeptide (TPR) repeat protein